MIFNLPNILTLLRIALIPVIFVLLVMPYDWSSWCAFTLYFAACLTDWFDGYYARKHQIVSAFGRFLDPIADKLLVTILLVVFASLGYLHGWSLAAACLILFREVMIAGLREFLGPHDIVIHVSKLAKWKTSAQMVALGLMMIPQTLLAGQIVLSAAAILTAITGYEYMKQGLKAIITMEDKNNAG